MHGLLSILRAGRRKLTESVLVLHETSAPRSRLLSCAGIAGPSPGEPGVFCA